MTSSITPTRPEINRTFPFEGFTVHTGSGPGWYEVALATDPSLFRPENRSRRTTSTFYSTRSQGAIPADGGESVYVVPPDVLSRFAGQDRLYYAVATFSGPDRSTATFTRFPPEVAPFVRISRSFTGQARRSIIGVPSVRSAQARNGTGYGGVDGDSLTWAGDGAVPGESEPVAPASTSSMSHPAAPIGTPAQGAPVARQTSYDDFDYDDGFGAMPITTSLGEDDDVSAYGIDGPIPDGETGADLASSLDAPTPDYPQASRFVPAKFFRAVSGQRTVNRIVIHITDGGPNVEGTMSWFLNPTRRDGTPLPVSAHYIVGQNGDIVQMVRDNDIAFHANSANGDSIGIEHCARSPHALGRNDAGLPPSTAQYAASAALVRWLCAQYNLPLDRQHIMGHSEADPQTTHTGCPNAVWDWTAYMNLVANSGVSTTSPSGSPADAGVAQSLSYATPSHGRVPTATRHRIVRARSHTLGDSSSFDIDWPDVQLVNQPTNMSCWAAAAAMVVGWRDRVSIDPAAIASGAGQWAAYQNGLNPADIPSLASAWGLAQEAPACYGIDAIREMVADRGPLWIGAAVPSLHAIVLTGIYGDGTPNGTFVRINDPWDRTSGTPGNPGPYLNTHDHGSQYVLTFTQFQQEYDGAPIASDAVNVQILHAADTGDRRAVSRGQAFAQSAGMPSRTERALQAAPVAVPIVSSILGATMTRVLNNDGDVRWELDQLNGLKHPFNDPSRSGPAPYTTSTITVQGPHAATVFGIDEIYADFEMQWHYNGHSLGDIRITNVHSNDAIGSGLQVKAIISDDPNSYTASGSSDPFAAINVQFYYRFTNPIWPDLIAIQDFTLYGDGQHAFIERRTQE